MYGGAGSGAYDDRRASTSSAFHAPMPDPGSPADLALASALSSHKKRRHRPEVLAVIQDGREAVKAKEEKRKRDKEIDTKHELYQLSYGMMVGISVAVGSQRQRKDLTLDDFMEVKKYVFPPEGSDETPAHKLQHSFKFKDYAPKPFRHLRERFGIDDNEYMSSLCGSYNFIEFMSNSKSGSFFFYSHDSRYMIKTQSKVESKFLRRIMAHYYQYVMKNPHTYITRFYGMHRIKIRYKDPKGTYYSRNLHFVVMQSVYSGSREIHEQYDLKGSTVGRFAKPKEIARGKDCVYKDLDLIKKGEEGKLKLGPNRRQFLEQIRKDSKFLDKLKIMDYSLLLGIHFKSRKDEAGVRRRSVHVGDAAEMARAVAAHNAALARAAGGAGSGSPDGSRDMVRPHHLEKDADGNLVRPDALKSRKSMPRRVRHDDIFTLPDDGIIEGVNEDGSVADEVYHMGIIDILQQYDTKKTVETWFKSLVHPTLGVSSVDPTTYAERFVRFLEDYSV